MKKLLVTAMIFGSGILAVPSIQAAPTAGMSASADPQIRIQIGRNRRYNRFRRMRTVVTTRIVHMGFRTYRETIRTTYFPNGTSRTEVINRERIRY
ncbi:MAG TPA: hypothetical protein VEV84_05705 [Pyrinomonadaceae bacterium]|jgi:hypothetical protein|nr:hypothetical protein [Pyrinomonadaceae bacterium]